MIDDDQNKSDETHTSTESMNMETDDKEDVVPEATRVFEPSSHEEVAPPAPSLSSISETRTSGQPEHSTKRSWHLGTILFIGILFLLGVWLSGQIRSFLEPVPSDEVIIPTLAPLAPSNLPIGTTPATGSATNSNVWQTYEVISGVTKQGIPGLSYQLPGSVRPPVCDSGSCASSGTNLPGGTRLTIAARGRGQLLPDFRGAILTDTAGREFTMQQRTISGVSVYEYVGNFTGSTSGGYTFTRMRGVLIPVSDTLGIDLNHFSPSGVVSDFAADDALFDEIIARVRTGSTTSTIAPPPTSTVEP